MVAKLKIPTAAAKAAVKQPATSRARKAREAREAGEAANAVADADTFFDAVTEDVRASDIGTSLVTSAQSEKMICGLELPGLAARYLFQQDVLTLGRVLMLVGEQHSCKSALLCEIYRWVLLHKGLAVHVETENKDSPDLRNSLLWYDPAMMKRLMYHPADSQQEWMEHVIGWQNKCEKRFAKIAAKKRTAKPKKDESAVAFRERTAAKVLDGKPGWLYPIIYGVDSLTAVGADGAIQKILDEGSPTKQWPEEALHLSRFAKTLAKTMRGRPVILASTNHLKPGQDAQGHAKDNIPGGKAMRFMDTCELKLTRLAAVKTAEYEARRIAIQMIKNSLGTDGLKVQVDLKWWWEVDEATGEPLQRTVFDWGTADIDMLLAQKNVSAKRWKAINDVVDIHVPEGGKRTFWSKTLGIPSSSPLRFDEAGKVLEANREILEALYPILHIKKRTKFTPGVDYQDLQEQLRRSARRMEPVYSPQDLTPVSFLDGEIMQQVRAIEARKADPADDDEEEDDDS
jgi:hypothetical protein